jgi:hypothetical protein
MVDAIFITLYTIPKVRAKSSSCLNWWRVESRQIVDKQTSLIDHTFDCSSDYWQWFICVHAQLHITLTTEFRWDCSFRVVYEKWLTLSLPSTQFLRLEQNHHLDFIDEESSRVQTNCWQTNFIDSSHIWLFFRLLTMIQWCSCPVAHYLDDWIQIGLLFPCSSHKMDDAIFTLYTIPEVRAKSSSCLNWWRVESRQIVDKQCSLIDHTFDCSSDYWQWFICVHAQLVAHYLDDWIQMRLLFPCSLWKMVDAIFTFYTIPEVRAKSSSRLYWWRVESSPDRLLTNKLHWFITHLIVLPITDNDSIKLMPSCTLPWRLNSDWTALSV